MELASAAVTIRLLSFFYPHSFLFNMLLKT